jgi:hypothetical protein
MGFSQLPTRAPKDVRIARSLTGPSGAVCHTAKSWRRRELGVGKVLDIFIWS